LDPEALIAQLVQIVSDRTGYPPEMLDPSLDLEADLGIDSIKRVEILNNFRKLLPKKCKLSLKAALRNWPAPKRCRALWSGSKLIWSAVKPRVQVQARK